MRTTVYHQLLVIAIISITSIICSCGEKKSTTNDNIAEPEVPHIVFVTGDEEYRSEESMVMLGNIIKDRMGAKVSICYALDSAGIINPNVNDNIVGLESLADADLAVFFMRWRALPKNQAKMITDYVESGRPIMGFRTSTHAFLYKEDSSMMHLNNKWPTEVFGQQWITHHGHFEDGHDPLTAVTVKDGNKHPILNGVQPFDAYSWLYHVDGGDWKLYGDHNVLLTGKSLRSKHEAAGKLDEYPITNPVAWTKSYTGTSGKKARVFFTTLGHPYDFRLSNMRTLALNGMYWTLGREEEIPAMGINPEFESIYEPNNSGFGEKFKKGVTPVFSF